MKYELSKAPEEEDDSSFWLITYSDMTTLLVAFFLVIYSFTLLGEAEQGELLHSLNVVTKGGKVERVDRVTLEKTADALVEALNKTVEDGAAGVVVESTENEVTVVLPSDVTFASGSATLQPEIAKQLREIAEVLQVNVEKLPNVVRVEGHTDSVPINTFQFPSNWHLSVARAQSVVRLFMDEGMDPAHLQVIGYADTRPMADDDTPEGRQTNRRIEIKILRTPEREEDLNGKSKPATKP